MLSVLCCISFSHRKRALLKHALPSRHDPLLHQSFSKLWEILLKTAEESEAGEIICIFDALDECEEQDRNRLIKSLVEFYQGYAGRLKFLVTSRPYVNIEIRFRELTRQFPTIRLAGEKETKSISNEIDLFIKYRVRKISLDLELEDSLQLIIENKLSKNPHRTYLWVTLILDIIKDRIDITEERLRPILNTLPTTLEDAYEAILRRVEDIDSATKLLHIIVAAVRPLTLKEMNVVLAVRKGCSRMEELDLLPENRILSTVRKYGGLFVTIIDSKIYLIHQTAREFLVSRSISQSVSDISRTGRIWKGSLESVKSNLILAQICVLYLSFTDWEENNISDRNSKWRNQKILGQYMEKYDFLEYAAKNWPTHVKHSGIDGDVETMKQILKICDPGSGRFRLWFPVFDVSLSPPHDSQILLLSYLGLDAVMQLL